MASSSFSNLPETLLKKAANVTNNLLPDLSRVRYETEYKKFCDWCKKEGINDVQNVSDDILLVYMSEMSINAKPSTLWSRYSMIKSSLKVKQNVDVSKFFKTIAFLKKQSDDFNIKRQTYSPLIR